MKVYLILLSCIVLMFFIYKLFKHTYKKPKIQMFYNGYFYRVMLKRGLLKKWSIVTCTEKMRQEFKDKNEAIKHYKQICKYYDELDKINTGYKKINTYVDSKVWKALHGEYDDE